MIPISLTACETNSKGAIPGLRVERGEPHFLFGGSMQGEAP